MAFVATLIAVAGLAPFAPTASAASNYTQVRYNGTDRFDTAALIASAIAEATPTAILARADIYPDALTGAFAAAANGEGPLLLTRSDSVPQRTLDSLQAENVDNVILLGGPAAISPAVQTQLEAAGYNVDRIFGATRYQTAIEIAEQGSSIIGTIDGQRSALISSGENFPDALAGAPLSFAAGLPSLLTPSNLDDAAKTSIFNEVVDALNRLNIETVFILGGPAAVAQNVEDALRNEGFAPSRLAGGNRSATSVEIFEFGLDENIYTNRRFGLARGDAFPDALAYAPLGGRPRTSPAPESGEADTGGMANGLLLAASHCTLSTDVENFITAHQTTWTQGEILGGPAAICAEVAAQVRDAATTDPASPDAEIALSPTSGQSGSQVTATYSGDRPAEITDISSSNCTITNQGSQTQNRTFNVSGAEGTECTITTTVTFTDAEGGTETVTRTFTITGPASAAATVRPELETAQLGATSDSGTLVTFCFDEEITGAETPNAELFHVYTFDGDTQYDGDDDGTPAPMITTNNCVEINFEAITTASNLRGSLSVATVDFGAVMDNEGDQNPIGDAPLGSGQQINLTAGQTAAPDLLSVTDCAAEPTGTGSDGDAIAESHCTFTFDEKAYTANSGGFHLVLLTGEQIDCVALAGVEGGMPANPAITDADNSIVTECEQTTTSGPITTAAVARGFVDENTVSDAVQDQGSRAANTGGAGVNGGGGDFVATQGCDPALPPNDPADECIGNLNPLQATDSPDGDTPGPDLVSATLNPGDGTFDSITYTFDETVQANPILAGFCFYDADGDQTCAVPGDTAVRGNPADDTVVVTFDDGALDQAVGASVLDGTVRDISNNPNQEDEEGMANANQSATSAGRTDNPDLIGVSITTVSGGTPGSGSFRATYVFDEDLDQSNLAGSEATEDPLGNPGKFFLIASDGTRYVATACETRTVGEGSPAGTEDTDNTVVCTAYAIATATGTSTGVVPTNLALFHTVVGTVDDGAVTEEGLTNGSNPEGAERTTGGPGTPAQ